MKSGLSLRSFLCVGLLLAALCAGYAAAPSGDGEIRGTVVSRPGGRPMASVWVVVSQWGAEKGRSLTDDGGQYYIGRLADGGYEIVVKSKDRELYRGQVSLPANRQYNISVR